MPTETWARVSLRIASGSLTAADVERLLGRPSSAAPDRAWAVDLVSDSSMALNEQLVIARDFLRDNAATLAELAKDAEMALMIGWTPRVPQDGIVLDIELIGLLSRFGCYVLLDTYSDG
jgi:hypothetical protein